MGKRKRDDDDDDEKDQEELKPVFVDTSLDTHVVILVSSLVSFSLLKERIVMEHSKCFPDFGNVSITALKVKREGKFYHLSGSMLLRTAFHGIESWFVFADVDASKRLKIKKKKRKSSAIVVDDLASSRSTENILKCETKNALDASVLETKGVMSGFERRASEPKQIGGKKDDLLKDEVAASNVLPSKVVESSTGSQTRKEERRDGKPDTSGHVHDASSISTDAPSKADMSKGTSGLLGQSEGGFLTQESVVHNAEGVSGSRAKKSKKRKKSVGDGVDKIHAAKFGEGPDIMRNGVTAVDNVKTTMDRELDGLKKQTDDSKLLLSKREGVERAGVNEEDVAPLISLELKISHSGNKSKKRESSKKTKKANVTYVDDDINGSHAVQQCQVPDSMQNSVTSLISKTSICERESDNKRTSQEEIKESIETKGLRSVFEGGVGKKDDLQKNDVGALNVLPSKVVEHSTVRETTKKKKRYGDRDKAGHAHDTSAVSTDAAMKTVTAKGTPESLEGTGKTLGSILDQGSLVYNAEAIPESRAKKPKKRKKDGVDKIHPSKLSEGPDIMRQDVAASGNEKFTLERKLDGTYTPEEGTFLKLTGDSQHLLSQREAALCSVESAWVNVEDVAPLNSLELRITDSGNTSIKRKSSKKTKKSKEKDVGRVNGSHATQQGQVPDIMQDSATATALDSDTFMCERDSDNKRTGKEEIKESGETNGLMSCFEGGVHKKDDQQKDEVAASNVLPSKVVESSTISETTKKERIYGDRNTTGDASFVSTDGPEKTVAAAKGTPELLGQLEGSILDQESVVHNAEAISGSQVKRPKKSKKSGGYGVEKIHALKLGEGPDIMRKCVAAVGSEKFTLERKLDGINTQAMRTPLKLTGDSEQLLSQHEVALCSVEIAGVNEEDVASVKSLDLKCMESENTSKKGISSRKTKKPNEKDVDGVNGSHAAQQNHVHSLISKTFICERESATKNTVQEETKESGDTVKKEKTHKTKTSVTTKQDLSNPSHNNDQALGGSSQDVAEMLQLTDTRKIEQSTDIRSKPRTRSARKQKLLNEKMKEVAAPKTVTVDCLRENGKIDLADPSEVHYEKLSDTPTSPVPANVVDGAKVDKPKASKEKAKKSKQNERICEVGTEIKNDILEAAGTEQICVKPLEPARSSKLVENNVPSSVNSKKKSKSKQTCPAIDAHEIPVTEQKERICEVGTEIKNDILEAAGTEQICVKPLEPARSSKLVENKVLSSVNSKKKSKSKQISPAIDAHEIPVTEQKERICEVGTEIKNDILEAAGTEQICVKPFEPARSSKLVENKVLSSVNSKKSKSKQTSPAIDAHEIPVTELFGEGKKADNSLLTNSSSCGNKHHRELGDGEQKLSTLEADSTSQSKRKKLKQPSSADTSSSLMTSKKGYESEKTHHQLHNDVGEQMRVIGVESIHPPEVTKEISNKPKKKHAAFENNLSNLHMNQLAIKTPKLMVEQADDVMLNSNINDSENQENVLLHEKRHDGLTEGKKLDKQRASKVKAKKLNMASSVDISCNGPDLVTSKKSEGNVQVGSELQNGDHDSEPLSRLGTKPLELHPISQHEEHMDVQNATLKKTMQKPIFSANGLYELEQPDLLKTNANGIDDKLNKGLSLPEGHYNNPTEMLSQEISSGLNEVTKPEKLPAGKPKVKNLVQPSSVDTEFKKESLTKSNKSGTGKNSLVQKSTIERDHGRKPHSSTNQSSSSKEEMGSQVPIGGPLNSGARTLGQNGCKASGTSSLISGISPKTNLLGKNTKEVQKKISQEHVFKTPSSKKQPASDLPQKKSVSATPGVLFGDLSSDSSDDEVERDGSSYSTRTPDDLSSSDYSEGESKGDVVTSSQNSIGGGSARDKTNFNLSALKNMNLESVLRSSSRYKKAKLVASQSQLEDGDSELPEFVPDSQA